MPCLHSSFQNQSSTRLIHTIPVSGGFHRSGRPKLHLRAWNTVYTREIRRIRPQNIALLTKHAWQLATTDHKPHLQLLKSKYLEHQPFFSLSPKPRRSYFWRCLCKTRETVFEGATYRAEKGDKINVWHDPWVSNIINSTPTAKILRTDRTDVSIAKVSELINSDYSWNAQMLEETFPTLVAHSITHPKRTGRRHTAYKC